jgi:hypothetical protein
MMIACHGVLLPQTVQRQTDGITVTLSHPTNGVKKLKLRIWTDNILQVIASPTDEFSTRRSLIITGSENLSTVVRPSKRLVVTRSQLNIELMGS